MPGKKQLIRHSVKELTGIKTDAELIIEYMQSDVDDISERMKLSPRLQEKLERIITAKSLLLQHKFANKVQRMLVNTYGYSEITAMRDIQLMGKVFGPLLRVGKDLKRAVAEEMIRQDRELAIELKDARSAVAATANYMKLNLLDKEDEELMDMSNFEFRMNIIAVMPQQVGINPPSEDELISVVDGWIENVDFEDIDE